MDEHTQAANKHTHTYTATCATWCTNTHTHTHCRMSCKWLFYLPQTCFPPSLLASLFFFLSNLPASCFIFSFLPSNDPSTISQLLFLCFLLQTSLLALIFGDKFDVKYLVWIGLHLEQVRGSGLAVSLTDCNCPASKRMIINLSVEKAVVIVVTGCILFRHISDWKNPGIILNNPRPFTLANDSFGILICVLSSHTLGH